MSSRDDRAADMGSAFLGSLPSEFDDSESGLHRDFEILAGLTGAVRSAYTAHRIRPESAAGLFRLLRLPSADGHEWTVGATSGGWYRRPVGGQSWEPAPSPVGVAPAGDPRPGWLDEGIARQIAEAETHTAGDRPAAAPAQEAVVNLFQPKADDGGTRHVTTTSRIPGTIGVQEDIDWILEEWGDFDSQVEELRGMRARVEPEKEKLPGRLPKDLKADRRLGDALNRSPGPADRVGSDVDPYPPMERQINPEDFFFRPDD